METKNKEIFSFNAHTHRSIFRGGCSNYTDTSEPIIINWAQITMVTAVQSRLSTSDLSITSSALANCATRAKNGRRERVKEVEQGAGEFGEDRRTLGGLGMSEAQITYYPLFLHFQTERVEEDERGTRNDSI